MLRSYPFYQINVEKEIQYESILGDLPPLYPAEVSIEHLDSLDQVTQTSDYDTLKPASLSNPIKVRKWNFSTITRPEAVKPVRHVVLEIEDCRWNCIAGNSFGLFCENDPLAVTSLMKILNLDGNSKIRIDSNKDYPEESIITLLKAKLVTIKDLLSLYLDLNHFPKKTFLRQLAEYCSEEKDRNILLLLASKLGSKDYMRLANDHVNIVDILCTFTSCKPSLEVIISNIPLLYPRFYSICNASSEKNKIEFIYSPTTYTMPDGSTRFGTCSSFLERLNSLPCNGDYILKVFPRDSPTFFTMTPKNNVPIFLICAGTGISPFIAFLRDFKENNDRRNVCLIYGIRDRNNEFLFKGEISSFVEEGYVKLYLAVSREQDYSQKYVQDVLHSISDHFYEKMTQEDGVVYICGDELKMIKSVNEALLGIVMEKGNMTLKAAQELLASWKTNNKLNRDVWI